jgi:hypothetical protein
LDEAERQKAALPGAGEDRAGVKSIDKVTKEFGNRLMLRVGRVTRRWWMRGPRNFVLLVLPLLLLPLLLLLAVVGRNRHRVRGNGPLREMMMVVVGDFLLRKRLRILLLPVLRRRRQRPKFRRF